MKIEDYNTNVCMNCKGHGCINCWKCTRSRLDPALDVGDIQRSRDEADAGLGFDAPDLVRRGEGPDTLPTAIVLFDPDLRPDRFDGSPADTR